MINTVEASILTFVLVGLTGVVHVLIARRGRGGE